MHHPERLIKLICLKSRAVVNEDIQKYRSTCPSLWPTHTSNRLKVCLHLSSSCMTRPSWHWERPPCRENPASKHMGNLGTKEPCQNAHQFLFQVPSPTVRRVSSPQSLLQSSSLKAETEAFYFHLGLTARLSAVVSYCHIPPPFCERNRKASSGPIKQMDVEETNGCQRLSPANTRPPEGRSESVYGYVWVCLSILFIWRGHTLSIVCPYRTLIVTWQCHMSCGYMCACMWCQFVSSVPEVD